VGRLGVNSEAGRPRGSSGSIRGLNPRLVDLESQLGVDYEAGRPRGSIRSRLRGWLTSVQVSSTSQLLRNRIFCKIRHGTVLSTADRVMDTRCPRW